ncbi:flagellar hook-associated protein FlgK [Campylobacter lanienae]|uniref:flagellar hook-associated protein FlgK n=2 Tax=Campylobacter lanienae TaxID=75658 RepID=UPI000BB3FDE0|nr:flagellar hook-associated protein FlgK [Campylobacter lanienae]
MGIFDSLYTGVSGLNAAQIQIQVTGQNITNVNSDYYTRQRVVQSAANPLHSTPGDIGLGTKVDTIIRIHDEFTFTKLKNSASNKESTAYKEQILKEIAQRFPDLQDTGLLNDIQNYYQAWNDFASHSYESSQKANLLNITTTLTNRINDTAYQLQNIHSKINEDIVLAVDEFNRLGQQIADLNKQIQAAETKGGTVNSNDLRDKRDQLEATMANLMNISTFKNDILSDSRYGGSMTDQGRDYTLSIDGITIVEGTNFHPLKLDTQGSKDGFATIYYELNDETRVEMSSKITNGKVGAMLDMRGRNLDGEGNLTDGTITDFRNNLDTFATTMIVNTNNIYALSAQNSMTSVDVKNMLPETPLQNHSSYIKSGSFTVNVYNSTGQVVATKTINIDASTTMDDTRQGNSIVSQFNSNIDGNNDNNLNNDLDDYFEAIYTYDEKNGTGHLGFLPKQAIGEYTISIEDNGTNFAGVFGMSQFFEGDKAANMQVEQSLRADSSKIKGNKAPIDGDNSMANEMIQLQTKQIDFVNKDGSVKNESIVGYYRYLTSDIASRTESVIALNSTNQSLYASVYAEHQSISGVNMDEELSNLIRFQSSYGAAAKIITTVDQMLNSLLSIKQ